MNIYRDAIECMHIQTLDAGLFENTDTQLSVLGNEDRLRVGIFWALKWATEHCHMTKSNDTIRSIDLISTIFLGATYDALVDILKCAKKDLVTLSVDRKSKEIICYEGSDLTGLDADIVEHQQAFSPIRGHASLTEDSDQVTSNWSAGDYRRVVRQMAEYASTQEGRIGIDPKLAEYIGLGDVSVPKPTLIWLDRTNQEPDSQVFDSLTLPSEMSVKFMWSARSLLETPIIKIADRFCALSSDLRTVSSVDDYMLRLAVRLDENQYSKVSGLREGRMVDICRVIFEGCNEPWEFRSPVKLRDPTQDADIVTSRSDNKFVIELKSTLRPETSWEVYKRNCELLGGLSQAQSLVRRGVAGRGLVITDGYRGDYRCWEKALMYDVTIGTLFDLEDLASDPQNAIQLIRQRAGVTTDKLAASRRLPERKAELLGWKLRLIDASLNDQ